MGYKDISGQKFSGEGAAAQPQKVGWIVHVRIGNGCSRPRPLRGLHNGVYPQY